MKKLLVTGCAGFIGTNVTIEAIKRGYTVIGFDNLHRPLTEENLKYLQDTYKDKFQFIHGDIRNIEDFAPLEGEGIEGIIHLAGQCGIPYAQINPRYDFEVNVGGMINVLEFSRLNGKIPVAFAASNKCYSNITNNYEIVEKDTRYEYAEVTDLFKWKTENGINERLPLDAFGKYARSLYGTSKVAADLYCQEYWQAFKVPTVINRMSCIYGLFQKGEESQGWADWMIRQLTYGNKKINIFGTGKQVRDMLWGEDVAKLYLDEIENIDKVAGKPYNIGGGINNTLSLLEAIKFMEDETGNKAELTFLPKRHGDQDIWISDISKIKNDLGWEPKISPQEGLKIMIDQIKKSHANVDVAGN